MFMPVTRGLALLAASLLLAGCAGQVATHQEAVQSVKEAEQAKTLVADSWSAADSGGIVDDGWLQSFADPQLMELVEEAQKNNFGLKIAQAEVERAGALAAQAGAALKPTVGLAGGYSGRDSDNLNEIYGGGLKISWEADVWGRIRSGVAGAEEAAAASRSDYEYARQSLAATTAGSWFLAVGSKVLADYSQEVARLLEKNLSITQTKEQVGQVTMKDVHLARAEYAAAQEAARQALAAKEDAVRGVELLLGRYPGAQLQAASELTAVPPPIAAGIPSEILERRPDLIAAEQRVAAAFYKQKEAELMHLPSFSFSVGLGLNSLTDAMGSLAAGIFAPLYTGGAIEAEVEKATAEQKQAIAAYAQTALQAFKEVESALANEEHLQKREEFLITVVAENLQAYQVMQKQFEIGMIGLLDVLTVQNKWVQARIALTDIQVMRLLNRIQLHLALGGSFE